MTSIIDRSFCPSPLGDERVDTTTINVGHAELKRLGYCFRTNAVNTPEAIAGAEEWSQQSDDNDFVVNPHAYDWYGRLMPDSVSIWGRKID